MIFLLLDLKYLMMLKSVQGKVDQAIAKKLTLEQFIASNPTAQYDETWGKAFLSPEQFLTIVYNDGMKARGQKPQSSSSAQPLEHSHHDHQHEQSMMPPKPLAVPVVRGLY